MTKHSFKGYILSVASLFSCGYTFTDEVVQEISLTNHISSKYLNATFGEEKTITLPAANETETLMGKFNKALDPKKELLTPREVQKIAFDIVSTNKFFKSTIIDNSCIDKLEIIGGGENSQQLLFGNIFSKINTATGKAHAAFTFCHPTTDITTLRNRQKAITLLSTTNIAKIDSALAEIKGYEEKSFMFWNSKSPVNADLLKPLYFGQQFDYQNILKSFNTNTIALETTNKLVKLFKLQRELFTFLV